MITEVNPAVAAAVVVQDGCVLLVRRRVSEGALSWHFPESRPSTLGRTAAGTPSAAGLQGRRDAVPPSPDASDAQGTVDEVRKLEKQRDGGSARKPGKPGTVDKWLWHWVQDIANP